MINHDRYSTYYSYYFRQGKYKEEHAWDSTLGTSGYKTESRLLPKESMFLYIPPMYSLGSNQRLTFGNECKRFHFGLRVIFHGYMIVE